MPWTDQPGPRPNRSEQELLAAVRRRAGDIRRARRTRLSAGLGGVVAMLAMATALARVGDDSSSSELRVIGPAATTSTTELVATTLVGQPTTTTTSPAAQPATTHPPPTTRTSPPTTEAPATTTTALAPATTTTLRPSLVVCDPADVVVTATLDRSTYQAGEPIRLTASAQNRGTQTCVPRNPSAEVFDSAGALVTRVATADAFTMPSPSDPAPAWEPGETLSLPFPSSLCSCSPGSYTVVVTFGGTYRSAPAPFAVN